MGIADNQCKGICRRMTTQQRIQVGQFAALAFVTHPDLLLRIPLAGAM